MLKSSIAFLLNPVSSCDRVDAALAALSAHRKRRPSLPLRTSDTKRAMPTAAREAISPSTKPQLDAPDVAPLHRQLMLSSSSSSSSSGSEVACSGHGSSPRVAESTKPSTCKPRRKRVRVRKPVPCTVAGCESFAVTRGCCVRHGGGARCEFAGCEKRAKKNKRCFTHGGCTQCLHEGCVSKAKRYGYCWAHGGGIPCAADGCDKVGTQGGLCWAHGGGSRCRVSGCARRSYQKDNYYCSHHG